MLHHSKECYDKYTEFMLLAIDVGNTNTVFALFDNEQMVTSIRFSTNKERTSDEYAVLLHQCLSFHLVKMDQISDVVISSVVPKTHFPLQSLCKQYFKCQPYIVGKEAVDLGIKILVDAPEEVGADRLVNAVAAYHQVGKAAIIVDFGTATTFDVVDNDGNYTGGVICPGIQLSIQALHDAASQLPEVAVVRPKRAIGKNTIDAMQSGIYWGYTAMIEGIVERLLLEMGTQAHLIATGGLAPLFCKETRVQMEYMPNLTINGLKLIYDRNVRS